MEFGKLEKVGKSGVVVVAHFSPSFSTFPFVKLNFFIKSDSLSYQPDSKTK